MTVHSVNTVLLCCRTRLSISLCGVTLTLQTVAERTRYDQKRGKWGDYSMIACLAQSRPLGLMPFDWLMLFTGTMLGGVIVLLF